MRVIRNGDELWIADQDGRGTGLKIHPYTTTVQQALVVGTNLTVGGSITDAGGPVVHQTDIDALRTELDALRAEVAELRGRL